MRRKTLLLMLLMALFSSGAWAQTVYSSYTYDNGTNFNPDSNTETPAKLVDNNTSTKWCYFANPWGSTVAYCEFHSNELITPVGYILTTGNDTYSHPNRNPQSWNIKAKVNQNDSWATIATVTNGSGDGLGTSNTTAYEFPISNNTTAYQYFRFEVTSVRGADTDGYYRMQLSEFKFKVVPNGGGGNTYNMPTGSITTCSGTLYDSGGPNNSYGNNENKTLTIYPETSGCKVQLNFTSFEIETCCDHFYIYDGTSTSDTQIGSYSSSPGTVTATNSSGALTIKFTSDGSVVKSGWAADISCACPSTEVEIGSSQSTSSYLPTAMYYNYSLSQQIYTPAEIGCTGTINKISFFHNGGNYARSIVIYMKKTTASTLSSYDSSPGTQVYSGSYTFISGWNTITLNTPFSYDDICKYLMITMDDNTGAYENNHTFATYSTGENRAMQIHSDGTNYNPTSSYSFTTEQSNNHIKLTMMVDSEYKILHATSNDINMGSFP